LVGGCGVQVAGYRLQGTGCRVRVAGWGVYAGVVQIINQIFYSHIQSFSHYTLHDPLFTLHS